jgi:O-antigen/teichoic acid export membrane protein
MVRRATSLAIALLCGLFVFSLVFAFSNNSTCASSPLIPQTASSSSNTLRVGLINNFTTSKLSESIAVDPSLSIQIINNTQFLQNLNANSLDIDVLVLANDSFDANMINGIQKYLNENGRIFLLLGSDNVTQVNLLEQLNLLSTPFAEVITQTATWNDTNTSNPIVSSVEWNSIPEARVYMQADWQSSAINVLLNSEELSAPLLLEANAYPGHLVIFTPLEDSIDNRDYELSLYYNYINYVILNYLAGQTFDSYTSWPYSPIPQPTQQIAIWTYLITIAVMGIGGYFIVRRLSARSFGKSSLRKILKMGAIQEAIETGKPITPEGFESQEPQPPSKAELPETSPVVVKPKVAPPKTPPVVMPKGAPPKVEPKETPSEAGGEESSPEEAKLAEEMQDTSSEWEQVGIHRQISQFFFNLILSFVVAIPALTLSLYVYPNFIMPFPQVTGWQNLVSGFFGTLATIFDMGIGAATVKFFAQYRVKDPQKAVRFLQLQTWWWVVTAIAKTYIIATVGILVFTHQATLAYLAWACVLNAITIFPGMTGILSTALSGMQRYDYQVLCNVLGGTVINTFINYGVILLCRAVFANNILYGDSFGTLVGLTVGSIVTTWTSFLYYSIAFKKLGFSIATVFRADFTMVEFKEAINYGWKLALGGLLVPLVGTLETTLVAVYVLNSSAELGYYAMMNNVASFVNSAQSIFSNLGAGISEAHGNGKYKLLSYYITEGLHYINMFTFVLFAVLVIIGGDLLVGFTGPFWAPATQFLVICCLYQVVTVFSTSGDTMLQYTGYTKYNAYAWAIEQSTRACLDLLLIPFLHQYIAVWYAYLPATTLKVIFEYYIVRKKIVKFEWATVHNFIAPGLAAAVVCGLDWMLLQVVFFPLMLVLPSLVVTLIFFLISVFSSLFLYLFLLAFFGGWDDNTLKQFERGLNVIKFVGKLFRAFYLVSEVGHRYSPVKNRFPVKMYDAAMLEAKELTLEKRKLVI